MGCVNFPAVVPVTFLQYQPLAPPLFLALFQFFIMPIKMFYAVGGLDYL